MFGYPTYDLLSLSIYPICATAHFPSMQWPNQKIVDEKDNHDDAQLTEGSRVSKKPRFY
jgi:hypothetical protein